MVIRALRHERQYSQDHLASIAKVDRTYIHLIETGQRSPKLDSLFKICDALDVEFSEFSALLVAKLPDAVKKIDEENRE